MPPQFCCFTQVTEPLQLYSTSGQIYSLSLQNVYEADGTHVNYQQLELTSLIELYNESFQSYGIVRKDYRRSPVQALGLTAVPSAYTHFSRLPGGDSIASVFLAVLETAVLLDDKRPLEAFLARKPGSYTSYYANFMKQSFQVDTLKWILDEVKMKGHARSIGQELVQMQREFYSEEGSAFPYRDIASSSVSEAAWLYHGLASIFQVVIEVVEDGVAKSFYPNCSTLICIRVAVSGDAWLYRKEFVHTFSCQNKFSELLLVDNLLAALMNARRLREQFKAYRDISGMRSSREAFSLAEKVSEHFIALVGASLSSCDGVLQFLYSRVTAQKSIVQLIDQRTCCMMRSCKSEASHFLECDHGICSACLIKTAIPSNTLPCIPCGIIVKDWKMSPPLTQNEKNEALASVPKRACSKCSKELKTGRFPLPKVYKDRVYQLECAEALCTHCLELCVRGGSGTCPTCNYYVDIREDEVMSMTCECAGCKQKKLLIRDFPTVACAGHRLCTECVSRLKHISHCGECGRHYSQEEQGVLATFSRLVCDKCGQPVRRARLVISENNECGCVLCVKCLSSMQRGSLDILHCPQCKAPHRGEEILIRSYQTVLNLIENAEFPEFKEFDEREKKWRERLPECPICQEKVISHLEKVGSGMCLHVFHRECLRDSIAFDIDRIVGQDLKRLVMCPALGCRSEVSTVYLTGTNVLISEGLYEKYMLYVISKTHKEFICGFCKKVDYIENELKNFACEGCRRDQCTTCKGLYLPGHDDRACKFNIIEQIIRDRFPENCECGGVGCERCTYSQCPGCKLPYLKNDHCDHVACLNPECKVEFCFRCSCLRVPTLEHCNTWHRRQCPNFPKDETPKMSEKIIKEEKLRDKCPECKRLGKMCLPPPDLQRIRRFALEEYPA